MDILLYYKLLSDVETHSKKEAVEVVMNTAAVTGMKIHCRTGTHSKPGRDAVIVSNFGWDKSFRLRFEHAVLVV